MSTNLKYFFNDSTLNDLFGCAPCKGGALLVGERPTRLNRSGRKQLEQSWR